MYTWWFTFVDIKPVNRYNVDIQCLLAYKPVTTTINPGEIVGVVTSHNLLVEPQRWSITNELHYVATTYCLT